MQIRHLIFLVLVFVVGTYAVYESRWVLFRPRLEVVEPKNGALLHTADVRVRGRSDPSTIIWIDGRQAESDTKGYFEDMVPAFPGYNEIGMMVKNRFGKETRTSIKFFVQ